MRRECGRRNDRRRDRERTGPRLCRWLSRLIALLAAAGIAAADGPLREVGLVESFLGSPGGYAIERAGASVPVVLFAPLYAGDRVAVREGGEQIQLRIGNDRSIALGPDDSPLVLEETGEAATVSGNVARWLSSWMQAQDDGVGPSAVALVSRGITLRAPLLEPPGPTLLAGVGRLHLVWDGGTPPYRARLLAAGTDAVVALAPALDVPRMWTATLDLEAGDYRLEVADAGGLRLERTLTARAKAPEPPPDLERLVPGSRLHTTALAAWLATVEEGAWLLEAYQRVARLGDSYRPAVVVRDALESRERPPTP